MPHNVYQNLSQHTGGGLSRAGPSAAAPLLWLLVQLHVGHQDVLLGLLSGVRVGAAVAGPLVGPPGPDSSPAVQVDHPDDQHHQNQARHHDNDQSGEVVCVHWEVTVRVCQDPYTYLNFFHYNMAADSHTYKLLLS